ncbi:hypothetical protein D3C87_443090 [compost metagenome]
MYVKKKGQTDDNQYCTFITSKVLASVGWQFPGFTYTNSSGGSTVVKPNVVQGNRDINSVPKNYDSAFYAVDKYGNGSLAARDTVDAVTITGIESKSVSTIYPVSPRSTFDIY